MEKPLKFAYRACKRAYKAKRQKRKKLDNRINKLIKIEYLSYHGLISQPTSFANLEEG
jgi:hypothetical protein